ncbi:uncharacterized protein FSUBG_1421 [Fusarium subglutinans]|uniref:Mucin-7 n=1 Tax=Gibberella subglutinans TaxID=42677 RepID=A0A8H5QD69_GIBSU|nr:uncharacterized protein FSUBG_1421 [Fusarium subglutinans]KAF5612614.1 hypothetical protein FSUBG_1421 [Fusarium subglutinans]
MSQVKNLRAMFENKGDTSPPDRGRSSGASTPVQGSGTGNSGTESPVRPLSKVRTSFVAIEKDGRIGLRRDPSHESSVSRRRLSMDTDAESVSTIPDKPSASLEDAPRAGKPFFQEAIPESPRHQIDPPKTPTEQMGAVTDEPSVNPDKKVDAEEPSPSLLPAEPATAEPVATSPPKKENKPPAAPAGANGKTKAENTKEAKLPKETAPAATVKASVPKKVTATRPSTISTKAPNTKPPAKSPSATRPTASATHKPEPKPAPKAAPAPKKDTKPAPRTTPTATRPSVTNATKKPQPLKPTPGDAPFVKPKPKSPTRPVHLPASLMAPTASSGAKTGRQVQPSASSQNLSVPARPASRASATGAGVSTGKTVKRQPSNVGRSRPSLGPPPKKTSDPAHPKKEAPVDESFLARMMRPTQASAQKTSEKVPTTPPKKTAKRPTSSGADATRRESSMKTPGSAKKPARKAAESKSVTGSVASDETSKVEPVVEEKAPESTKTESPEVPEIKTEEPQIHNAPKYLKKPEPGPVVDDAPVEVEEPVAEESQAEFAPEELSKKQQEKKEDVRPVTPETPKEVKPADVLETSATEEHIAPPSEDPTDESEEPREQEPATEFKKTLEDDVIVPLVDEGSTQPPVVVEETNRTSTTDSKPETTEEVIPLLEKDAESAETETAENKDNGVDIIEKNDTKEDEKGVEAVEEEDATGEKIDEEKKEEQESVTKAE